MSKNADQPKSQHPTTPAELKPYPAAKSRSRASSFSSVDSAVRTLRSRTTNLSPKDMVHETMKDTVPSRLTLADYMIKPVQRICKYPLVLDQLKPSRSVQAALPVHLRSDVDVIVGSAAQAMRHVAASVDEARHRQDIAIQSALIASRISFTSPAISQMTSVDSSFRAITSIFLSSLGTCLLAGSLDVMYSCTSQVLGSSRIHAKYLGAFLYLGGYLILAKVKGSVYEPKHWFSLSDFVVSEDKENDGMFTTSRSARVRF